MCVILTWAVIGVCLSVWPQAAACHNDEETLDSDLSVKKTPAVVRWCCCCCQTQTHTHMRVCIKSLVKRMIFSSLGFPLFSVNRLLRNRPKTRKRYEFFSHFYLKWIYSGLSQRSCWKKFYFMTFYGRICMFLIVMVWYQFSCQILTLVTWRVLLIVFSSALLRTLLT